MKSNQKYEWVIIGGGAAGISIAEILSRSSNSVLLIEKTQLSFIDDKSFSRMVSLWFTIYSFAG